MLYLVHDHVYVGANTMQASQKQNFAYVHYCNVILFLSSTVVIR